MVVTAIVYRADQHCGAERERFFPNRTYIAITFYNGIMTIRNKNFHFLTLADSNNCLLQLIIILIMW